MCIWKGKFIFGVYPNIQISYVKKGNFVWLKGLIGGFSFNKKGVVTN